MIGPRARAPRHLGQRYSGEHDGLEIGGRCSDRLRDLQPPGGIRPELVGPPAVDQSIHRDGA